MLTKLLTCPFDPFKEAIAYLLADGLLLPELVVSSGYSCTLCSYVKSDEHAIRKHFDEVHAVRRRGRNGFRLLAGPMRDRLLREHYGEHVTWTPVCFQRFFKSTIKGVRLFRVAGEPSHLENDITHCSISKPNMDRSSFIASKVLNQLASFDAAQKDQRSRVMEPAARTQVSPWLERTGWPNYLHHADLQTMAQLASLPSSIDETIVTQIAAAVDRIIEAAYQSVCKDRLNFFGQKRIASFLPRPSGYSASLIYKLKEGTYRTYKSIWKRLLAFVYRTHELHQPAELRHRLNTQQTELFDELLAEGQQQSSRHPNDTHAFDQKCLDFCIALLDDQLHRSIFESPIISFLAVLGIDENNNTFYEAGNYTPKLSAFIKIAQLFVLQKAVIIADYPQAPDAVKALDEMRERFLMVNTCTPFAWSVSLRAFGKRIRDSTTSLGYVQCSEDSAIIFYCGIELSIASFRDFIVQMVQKGQDQLSTLFLLGANEERIEVVPRLALHRLRDNPAMTASGWSFLNDPRNKEVLSCEEDWLLQRVLRSDRL